MRPSQPRLVLIIMGLTVLVWMIEAALGASSQLSVLAGFIPARVSGMEVPGALPVWLTPLSSSLLHAGILHLGFNMLMFGYCGRFVEQVLGSGSTLFVYLVGAYAAAAFQYISMPHGMTPMVGASGAISAIVGAYALLFSQRRGAALTSRWGHWLHVAQLAAAWIFIQLLIGFASLGSNVSIAVAAHIGGFVAGLLMARPLLLWRFRKA